MQTFPTSNSARGFTLLELLAVLTIMALLVVIAAPRLGSPLAGVERKRVTAQYRVALTRARSEALRSGRRVAVDVGTINPAGSFAPPVGGTAGQPAFFADGSSSGGTILFRGKPLLTIAWLTGTIRNAAE